MFGVTFLIKLFDNYYFLMVMPVVANFGVVVIVNDNYVKSTSLLYKVVNFLDTHYAVLNLLLYFLLRHTGVLNISFLRARFAPSVEDNKSRRRLISSSFSFNLIFNC